MHAERDLRILKKELDKRGALSVRLTDMYARELYMAGTKEDFEGAAAYFEAIAKNNEVISEMILDACAVMVRYHNILGMPISSCTYVGIAEDLGGCSEVYLELAKYYKEAGDIEKAREFCNKAKESEPVLDLRAWKEIPDELLTSMVKM